MLASACLYLVSNFAICFIIKPVDCYQDDENARAISLFKDVVSLNDAIEDEAKRVENLVRGVFAGNIFDLGSAQVGLVYLFCYDFYHLIFLLDLHLTHTPTSTRHSMLTIKMDFRTIYNYKLNQQF